jgi:DNA mismatch endonuclease (patch repair protein)
MQRQQTRDTAPELAVRRLLHRAGLRYRVDAPPLPGMRRRADVVFRPSQVALFVDGCFWHGCPRHGGRAPQANPNYWTSKLQRNQQRDADTDRRLRAAGWAVVRAWEHEDPAAIAQLAAHLVAERRPGSRQPSCPAPNPPSDRAAPDGRGRDAAAPGA